MADITPRRIKRGWMNLRVSRIVDETHDTKTFFLTDADDGGRAFDYEAGQYLTLRFDHIAEKPLVRSYTMSSSPNQPDEVALTIKRVDNGVVSNWTCDQVTVGSILRARGPIGKFCFHGLNHKSHLVMVAAGSGVTPFVSIMRQYAPLLGQEFAPKQMTLLVAYRSQQDLILWEDLQRLNQIPGCRVVTTLTRETAPGFWHGRPDRAMLDRVMNNNFADITCMTCGPEAMMQMVVHHCQAREVPDEQILTESFF